MATEKLKQASELIRAKKYIEAKAILSTIADHPKAQEWMVRIDDIMQDDDDPFGDFGNDDFYNEKPKRGKVNVHKSRNTVNVGKSKNDAFNAYGQVNVKRPTRDYTTLSLFILLLYWVFWLPGLIANIIFLNEAKQVEKDSGKRPDGMGCLWALLVFNVIPFIAICGVIFSLVLIGPEVEEIFDEITVTLQATVAR